ncbi:hypothetical protein CBL_07384 [Carabus blaptoides fortunei]
MIHNLRSKTYTNQLRKTFRTYKYNSAITNKYWQNANCKLSPPTHHSDGSATGTVAVEIESSSERYALLIILQQKQTRNLYQYRIGQKFTASIPSFSNISATSLNETGNSVTGAQNNLRAKPQPLSWYGALSDIVQYSQIPLNAESM